MGLGQAKVLAWSTCFPGGFSGAVNDDEGDAGQALDNALMESTIGLYETELIDLQKSRTGRAEIEREIASWVHWLNASRLHSSIGYVSPVDYKDEYCRQCSIATSERAVT